MQWRNIMEHQTNSCFTNYSCKDFITVLSGKSPVPGGGGAAALAGAIGIALGNMVGSLTVGKKRPMPLWKKDIIQCKKKADDITARLFRSRGKRRRSFEPLSAAYGMPKAHRKKLKKGRSNGSALVGACKFHLRSCGPAQRRSI